MKRRTKIILFALTSFAIVTVLGCNVNEGLFGLYGLSALGIIKM